MRGLPAGARTTGAVLVRHQDRPILDKPRSMRLVGAPRNFGLCRSELFTGDVDVRPLISYTCDSVVRIELFFPALFLLSFRTDKGGIDQGFECTFRRLPNDRDNLQT
jgi:hypothetical protein